MKLKKIIAGALILLSLTTSVFAKAKKADKNNGKLNVAYLVSENFAGPVVLWEDGGYDLEFVVVFVCFFSFCKN